jgi:hypothetical protein
MTTEKKPRSTRIYRVQSQGSPVRLVRATQTRTAAAHVALQGVEIRVATQDDLLDAFAAGVTVETSRGVTATA